MEEMYILPRRRHALESWETAVQGQNVEIKAETIESSRRDQTVKLIHIHFDKYVASFIVKIVNKAIRAVKPTTSTPPCHRTRKTDLPSWSTKSLSGRAIHIPDSVVSSQSAQPTSLSSSVGSEHISDTQLRSSAIWGPP